MSFPSAQAALAAGKTPEEALIHAFENDTPTGYSLLRHIAEMAEKEKKCTCPLQCLRKKVPLFSNDILRVEMRGNGVVVDVNPNSDVAGDIFRLLGTDAARPLVAKSLGTSFGFANCCKILASPTPADVAFTAAEQIMWQVEPDC
jgi:hypothetical protein